MKRRMTEMATCLPVPDDLVIDILLRLPIRSLMRCRCVCRSWRNLTRDRLSLHSYLTRLQANPGLILNSSVFIDFPSFYSQLHFVEHLDCDRPICSEFRLTIPSLDEFVVIGSCNGLLCLVHRMDRHMVSVCNPFTGEWVRFPSSVNRLSQPRKTEFGFGFSPKTNEYKIVGLFCVPHVIDIMRWEAFVWTSSHKSWRGLGKCCSDEVIDFEQTTNAFVNGVLHWIRRNNARPIVTFDIADEVFGEMTPPQTGERPGNYALGVLCGCLAITKSSTSDAEIWVMKDNGGLMESWTKYYSISFLEVVWNVGSVRALCFWKDGEILMCNNQALLSYDPKTTKLRRLNIPGLPPWFQAVTHAATLVKPRLCVGCSSCSRGKQGGYQFCCSSCSRGDRPRPPRGGGGIHNNVDCTTIATARNMRREERN